MFFIVIYLILLVPLLILETYFHISPYFQLIYCILLVFLTVYIINRIKKRYGGQNIKMGEEKNVLAETLHVKTNRAIERGDIEDFGSSFYLDVEENGKRKTLFLWGQYLDELGKNKFPNSEFVLIREGNTKELINLKLLGKYFEPEKVLPAFEKKLWKSGKCHEDGQIINKTIDEIS